MKELNMKFTGKIIKELREQANESQEQLANALNAPNRETIARWENGSRDLKREHIIAIAQHFNVSSDYLLGLSEVKSPNNDIKIACKVTGLSQGAIHNLQYINYKDNISLGINKDILNSLIESLNNYLLYYIRIYFSIRNKQNLLDRIILTKYCDDNNLGFSNEEIEERGKKIFSIKFDMLEATQKLMDYEIYEKNIKYKITECPFDLDLKEDINYLQYKLLKEIENWIFDEFELPLYCNLLDERFDNKYYDFYTEAINCILNDKEYREFILKNKYIDLSFGIRHEILDEKKECKDNVQHNPEEK